MSSFDKIKSEWAKADAADMAAMVFFGILLFGMGVLLIIGLTALVVVLVKSILIPLVIIAAIVLGIFWWVKK